MARMSIDDKFLHDPRVMRIAKECGWSRRETMGCLLDVWAVNYDRESEYLEEADIDIAADREGFARVMIRHGLAREMKRGIRITGAKKRIKYLRQKSESGREGGVKSGESRRNQREAKAKQTRSTGEALRNAPDLAPDPVPVLTPDPALALPQENPEHSPPARARDPVVPDAGRARLIHDAWEYGRARHAEIRESTDRNALPWPPLACGEGAAQLAARVRELTSSGDAEQTRTTLRRAVDVAVADSQRVGHLRWFTPSRIWTSASFWRAAEMTPEQAAQPRSSPGERVSPGVLAMRELEEMERKAGGQ